MSGGVVPSRIARARELYSSESSLGTVSGDDIDWDTGPLGAAPRTAVFGFDGGGAAITGGKEFTQRFEVGGTITGWYILSDGLVEIDLWKTTYTAYDDSSHPVVGDSICSAAKPAVTSGVKGSSASLGAWSSTTISTDDVIRAHVDSATATWAVLHLIYA